MVFDTLKSMLDNNTPEISPQEVEEKDLLVIDTRRKSAYQNGHIPGAINLTYGQIKNKQLEKLADVNKDETIAVVCVAGISSKKASKVLIEAGYENAKSMSGGMRAWQGQLET